MQLKLKMAELLQKMEWWSKDNKIWKEIWKWVISTLYSPTTVGEGHYFCREIFMGLKLTHWYGRSRFLQEVILGVCVCIKLDCEWGKIKRENYFGEIQKRSLAVSTRY